MSLAFCLPISVWAWYVVATDWEGLRAHYITLGLLLAGWIAYFVIQRRRNATSVTWQGRRIDVRRGSTRWTFHFDEIEAVELPR